jgi:hypothetical protein
VRSFFTHRSVSTLDRVPFHLTGELFFSELISYPPRTPATFPASSHSSLAIAASYDIALDGTSRVALATLPPLSRRSG